MLNLLTDALIRVRTVDGENQTLSLPDVYGAMMRDRVRSFPALRPHQRHAWHAFLAQLGAVALHRAGSTDPPEEPEAWRDLIRGLTPEWPGDEPWQLAVEDAAKPAFLQPPVPGGSLEGFKPVLTADALDLLVTSKNHDLKSAMAAEARPDDWLFALVNLQTMAGYGGVAGKDIRYYEIARMRGSGFSRIQIMLSPSTHPGAQLRRDIAGMLAMRDRIMREHEYYAADDGIALVWIVPWDGADALSLRKLDPFFIEICRRVRLINQDDKLSAVATGSKCSRINAKELSGKTGDFWAPVNILQGKAVGLYEAGFDYRTLSRLLFNSADIKLPFSMQVSESGGHTLWLVARGVSRWPVDGVNIKTAGYHERSVPFTREIASLLGSDEGRDRLAEVSEAQIADIRNAANALRRGIRFLVLDGVSYEEARKPKNQEKIDKAANPVLTRLDREVDSFFFETLWTRVGASETGGDALAAAQRTFRRRVVDIARSLLNEAAETVPCPSIRLPRARARAFRAFKQRIYDHFHDLRSFASAPV